jgi:sterol desaturase/sphingolipid hydroxylase (fatty acid hydroxylase superfamily)
MDLAAFLLVLVLSLVFASFFGHAVHWAIHQRWTGPIYRAHMDHHLKQYPPSDLLSEKYRYAAWHNSGTLLFTPPMVVIMVSMLGFLWLLGATAWIMVTFALTMLTFALINDYVHDSTHIIDHPLTRFKWYMKLRTTHFQHHFNMKRNFGIVLFTWDRLFGTFVKR